jgi:hypothetical protein
MKAKKALRRLTKVEAILSDVIDRCPATARGLRGLLDTAKTSVVRAQEVVQLRWPRRVRQRERRSPHGEASLPRAGSGFLSLPRSGGHRRSAKA